MEKKNKNEKLVKQETSFSTVVISIFFVLILAIIASLYVLDNYYFKDKDIEFSETDFKSNIIKKKSGNLKKPDLELFESQRFKELEKGYWHEFNEDELEIGNAMPFELKREEEEVTKN